MDNLFDMTTDEWFTMYGHIFLILLVALVLALFVGGGGGGRDGS